MAGIYVAYGLSWQYVFMALSVPLLVALFFIDIKHMILPNRLVFIVGLFALFHHALPVIVSDGGRLIDILPYVGAGIGYGVFAYVLSGVMKFFLKKDALGFGDIKFFIAAGLWLGFDALPVFCVASGTIGIILALFWQIYHKSEVFPFGPALIITLYGLFFLDGSLFL